MIRKWIASLKKRKTTMTIAAILVVFVTTYTLIMPALTVEKSNVSEAGIVLDQDVSNESDADAEQFSENMSVSLEEADEAPMPAQDFEQELKEEKITVSVKAEEGALPEETEMKVETVDDKDVLDKISEEAGKKANKDTAISEIQALDISFWHAGEEIEPENSVYVTIASEQIKDAEEPIIIHVNDEDSDKVADEQKGKAEIVEAMTDKDLKKKDITLAEDEIAFEAEQFSVYALVYTVDFHYEANGKTAEFSIPGGGFVSLEHVVEVLGITGSGENGGSASSASDGSGLNAENAGNEGEIASEDAVQLNEVEVSDATKKFVADVERVEFSSPDLVWVGKAERAVTVGELKEANGLEVEYSEDLTEEQIAEINAQKVEAGDWALISVRAFNTEETLTVTMKNGEQFVVNVTDGQIGDYTEATFTYTVNDENAGIIELMNSSGEVKATGTTVTDSLNSDSNNANRFAYPSANDGYRFVNWINGGKIYTPHPSSFTWTDDSTEGKNASFVVRPSKKDFDAGLYTDDTFTANFVENGYYLMTLLTTEGGHIGGNIQTVSTKDYHSGSAQAVAETGYRFVGWMDDEGYIRSTDVWLRPGTVNRDTVFTAMFEPDLEATIYYRTDSSRGTLERDSEVTQVGGTALGNVATAKEGFRFISWVDSKGFTVSTWEEFEPTGERIYDGAIYTAIFEPSQYDVLRIGVDDDSHGYISSEYKNAVGGVPVSMYIREDGTLPASLTAVAYEEFAFDHWEIDGNVLPDIGDHIPKDFDISPYMWDFSSDHIIFAYYKDNPNIATHTIHYEATTGGTVDNTTDQWKGSDASTVKGATAKANTNYTFAGWVEKTDNPNEVIAVKGSGTDNLKFVPSGELLKDTTYIAVFRPSKSVNNKNIGMVGYNMNVTDVPVTWGGVKDFVMTSSSNTIMYYSTNGGNYYASDQQFDIDKHIPSAEGYYFMGWFNKDRPSSSSSSGTSKNASLIKRSVIENNTVGKFKYTFKGTSNNRYTFEATWVGLDTASVIVPYDGAYHDLKATVQEVKGGEMVKEQRYLDLWTALLSQGSYRMGPVRFQLLDDSGNPVGSETSSFSRKEPGVYKVRVLADGYFDGDNFTLTRDISLTIYPAQVVIDKIWDDSSDLYGSRPDDLELDVNRTDSNGQNSIHNMTVEQMTGLSTEEPEWSVFGDAWRKVYDDVLVRPEGNPEDDQRSFYYQYFADEDVPDGYEQASIKREVARGEVDVAGNLKTTITITNKIKKTPITFIKKDDSGDNIDGAQIVVSMIKNAKNETPPNDMHWNFILGRQTEDLPDGFYKLEEKKPPKDYKGLSSPTYFKIVDGKVSLTTEDGTPVRNIDNFELIDDTTLAIINEEGRDDSDSVDLKLHKQDKDTSTAMTNVSFTLSGGAADITGTTDASGNLTLKIPKTDLGVWTSATQTKTFTLTETTPDKYQAAGPWTVTVKANGTREETIEDVKTTIYQWVIDSVGTLTGNEGVYTIENEKQKGSLKIKKTFSGIDLSQLSTEQKDAITFTVTGPYDYSEVYKLSELDEDLEKTICDLPIGEYTVTETRPDTTTPTGYTFVSTTYSVEDGKATVTEGEEAEVEVTNTYNAPTDITLLKVDKTSGESIGGAKFVLKKGLANTDLADLTITNITGEAAATVETLTINSSEVQAIVVPVGGIKIAGLADGDYTLTEVAAPAGYIITNSPLEFTTENGAVVDHNDDQTGMTFVVENEPGAALPNTGGTGTNLFYLIGSVLTAIGGMLLVMRRRKEKAA